jgi:hypothetical protein
VADGKVPPSATVDVPAALWGLAIASACG